MFKGWQIMDYHFNIDVAIKYGVNEAIMLQNMLFWTIRNKANGKNLHDGHTWTFNSVKAYGELFPFWSLKQIRGILDRLVKKGVLIKGNYNKMAYDKTNWYAFANEEQFVIDTTHCPQGQKELPPEANRLDTEGEPIPYNKPVKKQDKGTGNFNKLKSLYHSLYADKYNTKPITDVSDYSSLKSVCKKIPLPRAERLMVMFFEDKWYADKGNVLRQFSTFVKANNHKVSIPTEDDIKDTIWKALPPERRTERKLEELFKICPHTDKDDIREWTKQNI